MSEPRSDPSAPPVSGGKGVPRRHESLDHEQPTDVGLEDPTGTEVPGTDIFGDETVVRTRPGIKRPGIANALPGEGDPNDGGAT